VISLRPRGAPLALAHLCLSPLRFHRPQPKGLVPRNWPTAADCQLRKSLQLRFSLPSWFWLAANSDRWNWIEKLSMLWQVAIRAKRHKVLERIITLLAPLDLMVDRRGSLCHERPCAGRAPLSVFRDRGSRLELGGDHHRVDGGAVQKRLGHVHRVLLLRCSVANTRRQSCGCRRSGVPPVLLAPAAADNNLSRRQIP
jgi:hypothetical protein